jgi:hypothetical protein
MTRVVVMVWQSYLGPEHMMILMQLDVQLALDVGKEVMIKMTMALLLMGLDRLEFHGSEINLDNHMAQLHIYMLGSLQTPVHQNVDNVQAGHHSEEYGGVALHSQGLSTEKLLAT